MSPPPQQTASLRKPATSSAQREAEWTPPPFTIKELRSVIPKHCFERSAAHSFLYLSVDLALVGLMFFAATYIHLAPAWARLILWPVYWFAQGCVGTGLWVLAHECGHQAFSASKRLNDTVGWLLHSMLLVPYHSWRITHGQHHKSTSHMSKDQVYVPTKRSQSPAGHSDDGSLRSVFSESPIVTLLSLITLLLVGWPAYIIANAWSQKHGRRANHFEPSAPMFTAAQRPLVLLSDFGVLLMLALLAVTAQATSGWAVFAHYVVPYLWVNHWLVLITYLQHTDRAVPHYNNEEWNFVRGALGTVDRDYGVLNTVFHHIGDTHVAHHLFSEMPHYHAQEATKHLRALLKEYYLKDDTAIYTALYRNWRSCRFVEDEGAILWYRNENDPRPASLKSAEKLRTK